MSLVIGVLMGKRLPFVLWCKSKSQLPPMSTNSIGVALVAAMMALARVPRPWPTTLPNPGIYEMYLASDCILWKTDLAIRTPYLLFYVWAYNRCRKVPLTC